MIIALFPNAIKKNSGDISRGIREFLERHGVTVVADDETAAEIGAKSLSSVEPSSIDFLVSLGGDGTILRLLHHNPQLRAPILAINLGSLGFMADIPVDEIYPSLKNLLEGSYRIRTRMAMEGRIGSAGTFAVNDIVIHRARNQGLIDLAIYVDGKYLNTFSSDGIIIATPNGSTAYSLAAGGPILTPELNAFIITPISPHTISNRPIVLLPEVEICIEYISPREAVEVTFDGFPDVLMDNGETLRITRSERQFKLVTLPNHDYYSTLRTKLGWAGRLRT